MNNYEQIVFSSFPLVLRNHLKWNILKWTPEEWKYFLNSNEKFSFRNGHNSCSGTPLWERNCDTIEMDMCEFFDNFFLNKSKTDENWFYFDYKRLAECFGSKIDKLDISWKDFGVHDKTAKDSTIWIGTKGAHTPCHIDTYGCNIVAQIYGQKRWYLFPPSESKILKPTRVPYEESSIYSNINFSCGCGSLEGITEIRQVVLNPGDVLFVPFHWWHYVENLSSAISINVWVPTAVDSISQLEESLVKYFINSICKSTDEDIKTILNPNEDDLPRIKEERIVKEMSWCMKKCASLEKDTSSEICFPTDLQVPIISFEEFNNIQKQKCLKTNAPIKTNLNDLRNDIINAFCHPDVIALVRKKLQNSNFAIAIQANKNH